MAAAVETNPLDELSLRVIAWGEARGLTGVDRIQAQMCKITEEVGELAAAICRINKPGKKEEAADAIGDVFVTIVLLSAQLGLPFNECVAKAVTTIEGRTGETVNGVYQKAGE